MGFSSCTSVSLIIEFKGPWSCGGRGKGGLELCKTLISSGVIPSKQPQDNDYTGGERQPELREGRSATEN